MLNSFINETLNYKIQDYGCKIRKKIFTWSEEIQFLRIKYPYILTFVITNPEGHKDSYKKGRKCVSDLNIINK